MTDHMLIACAADTRKGYYDSLQAQVIAAGIDFIFQEIKPFSWRKLVLWEYALAASYPNALIAFCDAWDMLYFGSRREFEDVVGAQPLLFHADPQCWPDSRKGELYPPDRPLRAVNSRWKYVNGTGPAGTGAAIVKAIKYGLDNFPILDDSADVHDTSKDNDQRFYTDVYLAGYGDLDVTCKLSQSLVAVGSGELALRDGRLLNRVTGSRPLFAHANGASAMIGQKGLMDILQDYRPERPW